MPKVSSSRSRHSDDRQLTLNADMSLQRPKRSRQLTLDSHFGSATSAYDRAREVVGVSPEPRPTGLLDLPDELLDRIAANLDLVDAARCALVCSRLRGPSQAELYRSLDLNGEWNPYFRLARGQYPWQLMAGAMSYLSTRFKESARLLDYVKEIRAVSFEGGWLDEEQIIESLEEELVDDDATSVTSIVEAERLRLARNNPSDEPVLKECFDSFPVLPNVRTAHLRLYKHWEPWLRAWLRLMPNVESLCLDYIDDAATGLPISSDPWPELSHLRRLDVTGMEDDLAGFVISCVKQSRTLEALTLSAYTLWPGGMFMWMDHKDLQLAKALSDTDTIRKLSIPRELWDEMEACRRESGREKS